MYTMPLITARLGELKLIKKKLALLFIASILFIVGCGSDNGDNSNGEDGVYTVRIATAMDRTNPQMAGYPHFERIVEENLGDKVKIQYVGGPESIPAFNQGEAIQNGAIDMSWVASSYYAELVPEALITNFTGYSYEEEREKGSIEYLSSLHEEKMNAVLVGRASELPGGNYTIYLANDIEVNSMEDFDGLRIRGTATYTPLLERMGADTISMPGEEIYSALERGIIDGFAWAAYSVSDLGVEELVGSQVLPKFNRSDQLVLANLDFWNDLPEEIQDGLRDAVIESYYLMQEDISDLEEQEQAELMEHGAKMVELTDGDEYVDIALEASWEWMADRVDDIEALKEYFR